MSVETVLKLFYVINKAREAYNESQEASTILINRLSVLEEPLLKFQSERLTIAQDALDTLIEVLTGVKAFLDEYNTATMWRGLMRAVKSGKYAEDFKQ